MLSLMLTVKGTNLCRKVLQFEIGLLYLFRNHCRITHLAKCIIMVILSPDLKMILELKYPHTSFFMSSLCGVGVHVRVNNFSSKTTRPRDVLFFLKDTLSIEDEKLFKACKSVCSSVC